MERKEKKLYICKSFVSTSNMMIQNNLKPDFVDINKSLNICVTKLKKKLKIIKTF